jgi:hypothetical protein
MKKPWRCDAELPWMKSTGSNDRTKRTEKRQWEPAETATGKRTTTRKSDRHGARLSMIHSPHAAVNAATVHFPPAGR